MNQSCKDLILKHFVTLMKKCDVEKLKKPLIDKGIFTQKELDQIFSTNDARHNKRVFLFTIQKKDKAWVPLLESLRETNQSNLADMFLRRGPTVIQPQTPDEESEEMHLSDLNNLPVNHSVTPLPIQVTLSDKLYDTYENNGSVDFYKSSSMNRGRVLIINNYEFINDKPYPHRNGALVDDANLKKLFEQMGGWDLDHHNNKTALEMEAIITNFAHYQYNYLYDICFIIIMSHGGEKNSDTIIFGVDAFDDNNYISVSKIQTLFSNEHCKSWRSKPKIMIFPVCRGKDQQFPIRPELKTETDSTFTNCQTTNISLTANMRPLEDMLIAYSTLFGYKAHRDFNRGSWYIEILCQTFMNYAHNTSVDSLMMLIDQGLRRRLSENHTMQTAEYRNKGFKKLYLNPGLYLEQTIVKKYRDNNNV